MRTKPPRSLFHQLLLFLGLPLVILWGLSALTSYFNALDAATHAYDRSLLASARTVAERLLVRNGQLEVDVPYIVLDSFERNMHDRLYYKVVNPAGRVISGYDDLPGIPRFTRRSTLYPALAYFYNATYQGQPIRVILLYQPVNENGINGMAKITVAETIQSRRDLAGQLLISALLTQAGLVLFTVLLAYLLLRSLLKPMRRLSELMLRRRPEVLQPLPDWLPWSETRPLILAFNHYIRRLRVLISRQGRFGADASHQLKTPLMVLNTQVAVALASSDARQWRESLLAMKNTLGNTIGLTERLLQLSRLKNLEYEAQRDLLAVDVAKIAQQACFSRLSEARGKQIDLGYEGEESGLIVMGEPLLLGEMYGNLLDNALKYTPERGIVTVRALRRGNQAWLEVEDNGPGIDPSLSEQALMPFHRLDNSLDQYGAGLGLALVYDIARYHLSYPQLLPAPQSGGLLVRVCLDIVQPDEQQPLPGSKKKKRIFMGK